MARRGGGWRRSTHLALQGVDGGLARPLALLQCILTEEDGADGVQ